jgi:hypothetical protein
MWEVPCSLFGQEANYILTEIFVALCILEYGLDKVLTDSVHIFSLHHPQSYSQSRLYELCNWESVFK